MSEEKKEKPKPQPQKDIPWTPDETQVRTIELGEKPKEKKSKSEKPE